MICCICGEELELGDIIIQITQFQLGFNHLTSETLMIPISMEDGSTNKLAHSICPALMGAPLGLVGAGERLDV
jgi:hypothetical protein